MQVLIFQLFFQLLIYSQHATATVVLNSSVGMGQACPGEMVTYNCTVTQGFLLDWIVEPFLPTTAHVQFINTAPIGSSLDCSAVAAVQCEDFEFVATLTNTANPMIVFGTILADMTSTLAFTATASLNRTVVQCRGSTAFGFPTNSSILNVAAPPSPPWTPSYIVQQYGQDSVTLTVQWQPPQYDGGAPVNYTITVSPGLSPVTTSGTSVPVTVPYNVIHTVSIVATNCNGSSSAAMVIIPAIELPPSTVYTNEGNEFFVGFMENPPYFPSDNDDTFFISTNRSESVVPVNATVKGGNSTVLRANPGVINTLAIKSEETRMPPQGIHILAAEGNEITLFGANEEFISVDGFLALPCPWLPVEDYNYYAVSVPPSINSFVLINSHSAILIVSCNDDTQVTFIPTETVTDPQNLESTISAATNTTVTLAQAQPLYIQSKSDLTGTHIVSNKPISLFSGHECAYSPPTQGLQCDHLVEQIPPTSTWGRVFLTAPSADRKTGDTFKIVASQENTTINITCVNKAEPVDTFMAPKFTITLEAAGMSWNFTARATEYCSIEACKPILVTQFGLGDANIGVDTYLTLVPAVSQYRNNIQFSVVSSSLGFAQSHWAKIFVTPTSFQPANITVDGVHGSSDGWVAIYCSNGDVCGYARQIQLHGTHSRLIRHDNPSASIGVIIHGSIGPKAYGYPGGLRLSVE